MKKFITAVLSGIMCLSLCACNVQETVSDIAEEVTSSDTSEKIYKVNESAKADDVVVTMTDVYESEGEPYLEPEEGNVFVICEFNIENNSDKEINISSMLNFDAYCDDYSCELSISALSSNNDKQQLDGTIAAGKKFSGIVGYEVPAEWTNIEVRYAPDILKDDKLIFVYEK